MGWSSVLLACVTSSLHQLPTFLSVSFCLCIFFSKRAEEVLTSTNNLCFEQKYEKYHFFFSENFPFLVVNFSIYLNRRVFVMICHEPYLHIYIKIFEYFPYHISLNIRTRVFAKATKRTFAYAPSEDSDQPASRMQSFSCGLRSALFRRLI